MMKGRIKGLLLSTILAIAMISGHNVQEASAGDEGKFSGTWTVSGEWQPLEFEAGREVFTYKLSGHVNLKTELGEVKDFWSECIGLWDSQTGGSTRCVWRDTDGKASAYIILTGQLAEEGVKVTGEIIGGAGELDGLTGTLFFTWSSEFRDKSNHVLTGYTKDLTGSYRISKSN